MCDAAVFIGLFRKKEPELFASEGSDAGLLCYLWDGKRGRAAGFGVSGGRVFESSKPQIIIFDTLDAFPFRLGNMG